MEEEEYKRFGAMAVANYFIDLARRDGKELTPQRLMALIYVAHGFSLAVFRRGILDPRYDRVEAWDRCYSGYYPKAIERERIAKEARERERKDKEARGLAARVWRKFWRPRE